MFSKVVIQTCISCPIRVTLLTPLVKWGHEKGPHEGRLILQSGVEPGSCAGIAERTPASGLWPRPSTKGEGKVRLSAVLVLVLQRLVEGHLLVRSSHDRFLEAAWRPRLSTSGDGSSSTNDSVRNLVTMESVPLGIGEGEVSK